MRNFRIAWCNPKYIKN